VLIQVGSTVRTNTEGCQEKPVPSRPEERPTLKVEWYTKEKRKETLNSKTPTSKGEGSCVFCPFRYGERRANYLHTRDERDTKYGTEVGKF
jgi:hypothetical protein